MSIVQCAYQTLLNLSALRLGAAAVCLDISLAGFTQVGVHSVVLGSLHRHISLQELMGLSGMMQNEANVGSNCTHKHVWHI